MSKEASKVLFEERYGALVEGMSLVPGQKLILFDLDQTLADGDALQLALEAACHRLLPELLTSIPRPKI